MSTTTIVDHKPLGKLLFPRKTATAAFHQNGESSLAMPVPTVPSAPRASIFPLKRKLQPNASAPATAAEQQPASTTENVLPKPAIVAPQTAPKSLFPRKTIAASAAVAVPKAPMISASQAPTDAAAQNAVASTADTASSANDSGNKSVLEGVEPSSLALDGRPPVFQVEEYDQPQRFVLEAAMRSASFESNDREVANLRVAFARAQARKVGMGPAAYTNNVIRQVDSARAHSQNGVTLLSSTPYIEQSGGFAVSFLSSMIECAPESNLAEVPPSDELRSASEPVRYDYLESFMASARSNEYPCAKNRDCFGMRLYDENNRPLPPTVWKVFWKPSELPDVLETPERFEQEAASRHCIGCKLELAANHIFCVAAHNNRVRPNVLACDIHVFVDIHGEFPVVATIGRGSNGHFGLMQNIPRISRVGWRAEPDSQRTGCYQYKWNIPRFPIPESYYMRDATRGASQASF